MIFLAVLWSYVTDARLWWRHRHLRRNAAALSRAYERAGQPAMTAVEYERFRADFSKSMDEYFGIKR